MLVLFGVGKGATSPAPFRRFDVRRFSLGLPRAGVRIRCGAAEGYYLAGSCWREKPVSGLQPAQVPASTINKAA
ncbi:MAG: hypothetical protein J2P53_09110 [Bradyrhizobiaceae bacterium]|nr:hypothetical protein [Bradyrhizobiaceae bacterium]